MGASETNLDAFCGRESVKFGYGLPHVVCGFVEEGSGRIPGGFGFADQALSRGVGAKDVGCALDSFAFGQVDGEVQGGSGDAECDHCEARGEHRCGVNDIEGSGLGRRFFESVRAFRRDKEVVGFEAEACGAAETANEPLVDDFDFRLGYQKGSHLFCGGAIGFVHRA